MAQTKMTQKERGEDGRFLSLGNGKFGGFKAGVVNGPAPRTKRGKQSTNVNWNKS